MSHPARLSATLVVFAVTLTLVAVRPKRWSEAWWTSLGAAAMLSLGLVAPRDALETALAGKNALLFLGSLLLLSALVSKSGFFEWSALHCARFARGDARALYRNTFVLGAVVTALMSLDTTAVMLTPVVLALVRRIRVAATPYIALCAFVANVGSLALPTSNLTNLLFADSLRLSFLEFGLWMIFPQLATLAVAFYLLRWHFSGDLGTRFDTCSLVEPSTVVEQRLYFRISLAVLLAVLGGYFVGPRLGVEPYVTCLLGCALLAIARALTQSGETSVVREISWSLFPFVIGLFVVVRGLENLGIVPILTHFVSRLREGSLTQIAWVVGSASVASNAINNLPAALIARSVVMASEAHRTVAFSALLGCDVGATITPFGSLATMLVVALARRDGQRVSTVRLMCLSAWSIPIVLATGGVAMWLVFLVTQRFAIAP